MSSTAQTVARGLAAGRVGIGAALCVAPDLAAGWAGQAVRSPGGRVMVRALGARDAALGAGALASSGRSDQLRLWLIASAAADAADFAATLAGPPAPARTFVLGVAAGAALVGLAVAAVL